MSLAQRVVRSALFNILSSYGQQVLGFLSNLVLARLLTPDEFGTYGLALAVYLVFARLRTFGFNSVFFSVPDPDQKDMGTLLWLSAGTSLLVIVVVGLASPVVKLLYGPQLTTVVVMVSLIALFEIDGLASTADALLRRDLSFRRLATLNVLGTALSLLTTILLAFADWGTWALVAGYAVKTLTYFVGTWIYAPRFSIRAFDWERARYFWKHAKNLWLGGMGTYLALSYDDLAVGTFAGTASLGHYGRAYNLSLLPLAFISGAAEVMMPTYARARDNREALTLAATTILDVVTKFVFPVGALLAITAPEVIPLYLGPQWFPAIPMLQALALYAVFRPANDVIGSLAVVMGRTDITRRYGLILSLFMLVVCTVLTLWMGAVGAALSAGASMILGLLIYYFGVLRHFTDVKYAQVVIPPSLAIVVASAAAILVPRQLATESLIVVLIVKAAVFGVGYVGLLGAMQGRLLIEKARYILTSLRAPSDQPPTSPDDN
jgi:O-antigen/teichoic acid export membrane protein